MNKNNKIIFVGFILTFTSICIFIFLNKDKYAKIFLEKITVENNLISYNFHKILNKKSLKKDLKLYNKFLDQALQKTTFCGAIIIQNKTNKIIAYKRKDTIFPSTIEFQKILNNLIQKQFHFNGKFLVRFYRDSSKKRSDKLLLFQKKINNKKVLTVFPYLVDKKYIIKFILSIIIIIAVITILTATIIILLKQNGGNKKRPSPKKVKMPKKEKPDQPLSESKENEKKIYSLLNPLYQNFKLSYLSLYTLSENLTVQKNFEMKDNIFKKITKTERESINLKNNIGLELQNNHHIIFDENKKILFPLFYETKIFGALLVINENPILSTEINTIKSKLKTISQDLKNNIELLIT